ncbi:hypothetical protein FC52_GL000204 [Lactobacillus pasteurii DSM 23907 = CRBIP 24.76]|uniref:Uncharacterized protein n=1 Tax=Lactobacillus pasteurii DSM 23907 = CRBIP 24.76 TaxID=1423790 RepID=I7J0C7_9LACO|nr:hypothetical protein [Lactobacillus pasteurii]KRK08507.1 hypothetical protein FC52_GL000204 [Lactobacillus pasteurii DSM 23907 = CRBIP 24.76]TDG75686.1 hypothetical protein C5L33_000571 [Lactobacillus pasteurii]CCI85632.1 Protein of unknown function [Lactobacillus pasteurii DSM 23907 = CRBIP 24.76]
MKKAIFAGVIALGMLGTGVAITTKPADAAVSYAKYTVSPKVRGNWKLKSVKHPTPWVVYKKMKIDAHSIMLNRLTTKITGMNPVSRKMYSKLALSGKYYFYTMIAEAASGGKMVRKGNQLSLNKELVQ